jgi:hypothetical protein
MAVKKFKLVNHVDDVTKAVEETLQTALAEIGLKAEGYAKLKSPVDTGRLRNSISWATATEKGVGADPKAQPEENTVYIGSNVEYAVYQELGDFSHPVGYSPFLEPALSDHIDEYKEILEKELGKLNN